MPTLCNFQPPRQCRFVSVRGLTPERPQRVRGLTPERFIFFVGAMATSLGGRSSARAWRIRLLIVTRKMREVSSGGVGDDALQACGKLRGLLRMLGDEVVLFVRVGGEIEKQRLGDVSGGEARIGCVRAAAHAT